MLIAILSDIHGNLPALDAVLEDAKDQGVQEYWCLGDLVGYGPWPLQVYQRLVAEAIPPWGWVAGNHDWGLIGRLDEHRYAEINGKRFPMGYFYSEASTVMTFHKDSLQGYTPLVESLKTLPLVVSPRRGVYATHGRFMRGDLADNVIQYTRERAQAEWSWETLKGHPLVGNTDSTSQIVSPEGWGQPRLMIVGHTHRPALWRRHAALPSNGDRWERLPLPLEEWEPLHDLEARPVHLNPGSVGQPRDHSSLARYALLEWAPPQNPQVRFREIVYKYQRTQNEMRRHGYPEKLVEILDRSNAT